MGATAPMYKQADGPAVEQAADADRPGLTQTAAVVVTRGVRAGVQSGLNVPIRDVCRQPIALTPLAGRSAGDKLDRPTTIWFRHRLGHSCA